MRTCHCIPSNEVDVASTGPTVDSTPAIEPEIPTIPSLIGFLACGIQCKCGVFLFSL